MSDPKTPLRNARWEKFAQGVAKDLSATRAYVDAGYRATGHGAEVNGSLLLKNTEVLARVTELRRAVAERVIEKTAISMADVITELAKIGFANMKDYVRVTSAGEAYIDLSDLTHEQAAAIGEITIEDFKGDRGKEGRNVRRTKIKLLDKRAALVDIGKHLGGFVERKEVGGPGDFDKMDDNELRNYVAERAKKILASTSGPGITGRSVPPRGKPH